MIRRRKQLRISSPVFRWLFPGGRRRNHVRPRKEPREEPRKKAPTCEDVRKMISKSVVELIINGSSFGQLISVPGVILMVNQNLLSILFGGRLITEGSSYQIRLPGTTGPEDVLFEDFTIMVKSNDSEEEARLVLLSYRTELAQHCCRTLLGTNCSENEVVFMYDFRFCDLELTTIIFDSSLIDGHVNFADGSTLMVDCNVVSHSYLGSLIFDSIGKLVGIAFSEIGPILAFQASFIQSVLLELNPRAKSMEDIFLNVRS